MLKYAVGALVAGIGYAAIYVGSKATDHLYPIAAAKVSQVLDSTNLPMMVFGERGASAKHWRIDAATTMWALQGNNYVEILRLSATAHAEAEGTRIHVDVLPPHSSVHDQVEKALNENGAFRDLYTSALAEQIDAKLTNREFAIANISAATARVTLAALPHLRESMKNADAEYQQREQEKIDRVYADER